MIFQLTPGDVETAKLLYVAQFSHIGCGGYPLAEGGMLTCCGCGLRISWEELLGAAIKNSGLFRSLIV